eukprot:17961_5
MISGYEPTYCRTSPISSLPKGFNTMYVAYSFAVSSSVPNNFSKSLLVSRLYRYVIITWNLLKNAIFSLMILSFPESLSSSYLV